LSCSLLLVIGSTASATGSLSALTNWPSDATERMEASNGTVRGVIDSLMKVMAALEAAGVEFINEGAVSSGGGRGVRLRQRSG
jgi:hypothetical protein